MINKLMLLTLFLNVSNVSLAQTAAILFEHAEFKGRTTSLDEGTYNDLRNLGWDNELFGSDINDKVSSIQLRSGCEIYICDNIHPGRDGWCTTLRTDTSWLTGVDINGRAVDLNDRISFVSIHCSH